MGAGQPALGIAEVLAARPAVDAVARTTPVFASRALSEALGGPVVLKAENLQRTGSFKLRGVANKLAALGPAARAGIVVASAGNHAQAAAYAARAAGIECEVFMPADASIAKSEATAGYGATVRLSGETIEEALALARERAEESGRVLIHPFDDPAVIAGQGTIGLELVEQLPGLARVVVPLGGGGLLAGTAVALRALRPDVEVIGVQAASCAPFPVSLASGVPSGVSGVPTLADGIAVPRPGVFTFPIVSALVDAVLTVDEDAIADAMVLLLERSKLVVEGAGAVGAAAVLAGLLEPRPGITALICSGGNVDAGLLSAVIRRHETNAGRRVVLFVRVSDRPGKLAQLLLVVGQTGANLVAVEHLREGFDLHVRETAVHLVLETRNRGHAASVLAAVGAAGYEVSAVGRSGQIHERGGTDAAPVGRPGSGAGGG